MWKLLGPALAGLFTFIGTATVAAEPDFSKFSHDDALAYSQAAIGSTVEGIVLTRPDGTSVSLEDYRGKPLVISMILRVLFTVCANGFLPISLLMLKPTSERNVDADDRAAATIPASRKAPKISGTIDFEAHIRTVSEGLISVFAKFMSPPAP